MLTSFVEHPSLIPGLDPGRGSMCARAVGLHYVRIGGPSITRKRVGKAFHYFDEDGARIRDEETLRRIAALAIPPAYRDVWICPDPFGHIQATGRDVRGRKQYRYHAHFRAVRDALKFHRMLSFAAALPRIRAATDRDLGLPGLPRAKVLATVVRLLEQTKIRVGNEEYAKHNHSFGLTTMKNEHVRVVGSKVRFHFRGKSGREHSVGVDDQRLAKIVRRCLEIPGQELFQYLGDDGGRHSIDSADVNDYLRAISGASFTAKDFRTWAGTVHAAELLRRAPACTSKRDARTKILRAIEQVSQRLGNTPSVCKKSYVHPAVLDAFEGGFILEVKPSRAARDRSPHALNLDERFAVALLSAMSRRERDARDLEGTLQRSISRGKKRAA